jgi:hypothetical protein
LKDKCPKPVKDTKNNSSKKGSSVNAAVEDSEDEASFFVEGRWESNHNLPDVENLFSKVDESDEHSGQETEKLFEANGSKCDPHFSVDSNLETSDLEETAVHVDTGSVTDHTPHIEVYDLGCARHITPY